MTRSTSANSLEQNPSAASNARSRSERVAARKRKVGASLAKFEQKTPNFFALPPSLSSLRNRPRPARATTAPAKSNPPEPTSASNRHAAAVTADDSDSDESLPDRHDPPAALSAEPTVQPVSDPAAESDAVPPLADPPPPHHLSEDPNTSCSAPDDSQELEAQDIPSQDIASQDISMQDASPLIAPTPDIESLNMTSQSAQLPNPQSHDVSTSRSQSPFLSDVMGSQINPSPSLLDSPLSIDDKAGSQSASGTTQPLDLPIAHADIAATSSSSLLSDDLSSEMVSSALSNLDSTSLQSSTHPVNLSVTTSHDQAGSLSHPQTPSAASLEAAVQHIKPTDTAPVVPLPASPPKDLLHELHLPLDTHATDAGMIQVDSQIFESIDQFCGTNASHDDQAWDLLMEEMTHATPARPRDPKTLTEALKSKIGALEHSDAQSLLSPQPPTPLPSFLKPKGDVAELTLTSDAKLRLATSARDEDGDSKPIAAESSSSSADEAAEAVEADAPADMNSRPAQQTQTDLHPESCDRDDVDSELASLEIAHAASKTASFDSDVASPRRERHDVTHADSQSRYPGSKFTEPAAESHVGTRRRVTFSGSVWNTYSPPRSPDYGDVSEEDRDEQDLSEDATADLQRAESKGRLLPEPTPFGNGNAVESRDQAGDHSNHDSFSDNPDEPEGDHDYGNGAGGLPGDGDAEVNVRRDRNASRLGRYDLSDSDSQGTPPPVARYQPQASPFARSPSVDWTEHDESAVSSHRSPSPSREVAAAQKDKDARPALASLPTDDSQTPLRKAGRSASTRTPGRKSHETRDIKDTAAPVLAKRPAVKAPSKQPRPQHIQKQSQMLTETNATPPRTRQACRRAGLVLKQTLDRWGGSLQTQVARIAENDSVADAVSGPSRSVPSVEPVARKPPSLRRPQPSATANGTHDRKRTAPTRSHYPDSDTPPDDDDDDDDLPQTAATDRWRAALSESASEDEAAVQSQRRSQSAQRYRQNVPSDPLPQPRTRQQSKRKREPAASQDNDSSDEHEVEDEEEEEAPRRTRRKGAKAKKLTLPRSQRRQKHVHVVIDSD
ncbi:uncharacterized protein BJ171DRAFT_5602 [Polychytrium aggregatum]|uniref:uncharacterized protein n=1 Tax=Polychytrium aggregatum TaxID=110093 RepID=UPI0022FDE340|nr:uncharacterized protein BJ171DRAFT_5602 [Polychytrium aggregatum]KAI9209673.1 hypothetical protein BJ171DRAFT_5602 [Polychytrium aggregatum]